VAIYSLSSSGHQGATLDLKDDEGWNVLMWAALAGDLDVCEMLVRVQGIPQQPSPDLLPQSMKLLIQNYGAQQCELRKHDKYARFGNAGANCEHLNNSTQRVRREHYALAGTMRPKGPKGPHGPMGPNGPANCEFQNNYCWFHCELRRCEQFH